jgi:hypothetical protein
MSSKKRHPAFNRKHPAIGWFYIKKTSCISANYKEKYPIMMAILGEGFVLVVTLQWI